MNEHIEQDDSAEDAADEDLYDRFIREAVDAEQVWGLRDEQGWITSRTEDDEDCIPFWSNAEAAHDCAEGPWAGTEAKALDLHSFMHNWLPGLASDGFLIAVYPLPDDGSIVVDPEELRDNLQAERDGL